MTRQQIGAWRVIWRDTTAITGNGLNTQWICRCQCGTVRSIRGDILRQAASMSCGCMDRLQAMKYESKVRDDEQYDWVWSE